MVYVGDEGTKMEIEFNNYAFCFVFSVFIASQINSTHFRSGSQHNGYPFVIDDLNKKIKLLPATGFSHPGTQELLGTIPNSSTTFHPVCG